MLATTWTEVGIFWISCILALITITATIINYLFFRSQIDPNIIVYVTLDNDRATIILLVIENIGKGLAYDISFKTNREIPEHAFGFENAKMPESMKSGPLVSGIPALGPSARRVITWGQYGGLKKGIGEEVINITIKYKSKNTIIPGYKHHETYCPIEIMSFKGTEASDTNWEKKSSEALERIAKAVEKK